MTGLGRLPIVKTVRDRIPDVFVPEETLTRRAYLALRDGLIHGKLMPGRRLSLRPLAADLGFSPTPVREALLCLVGEEALVSDWKGSVLVPFADTAMCSEIHTIRRDLEGRAAEQAARHTTAGDLDDLDDLLRMREAAKLAGNVVAERAATASLRRAFCEISGLPLITRILEVLWMRLGPMAALVEGRAPSIGHAGNRRGACDDAMNALVQALRDGDRAAARDAAHRDVDWSMQAIMPRAAHSSPRALPKERPPVQCQPPPP
ncbi:MAG: GntR family transcriptional regulator [Janthinobacterium lividum]